MGGGTRTMILVIALAACIPAIQSPAARSRPVLLSSASATSVELLQQVWEATPKSLLRIGKSGAAKSHANSLNELCAAHPVVAVKFNGPIPVDEAAAVLCNLASDVVSDNLLEPVLLATRRLRRGGSQGLYAQRARVGEDENAVPQFLLDVVEARKARLAEDAKYAALRADEN